MGEFERREAEKRDAERSKNDLEAYIISTGALLEDGAYDEVICSASAVSALVLSHLGFCMLSAGSVRQHSLIQCTPHLMCMMYQ